MKKYLILILALAFVVSCEEDVLIFDVDNGQTLAKFTASSGLLGTPADGATYQVDVQVTTKTDSDRTISIAVDPSSTATSDQYAISDLVIPAGTYSGTVTITSNFEALPEEGSTTLILNLTDVSGSNDIVFANSTLTLTLFRECPILGGDWVIEMSDSFGDGWQTTGPDGGPGLSITLSTGEVFEVGLCTPYEANTYVCTDEPSFGTATVTFPDGVESAEWFFPGDNWGEISFAIYSPDGNLVAEYGPNTPAGVLVLDYCLQ
jgi:hypothetical protein